MGDRKQAVFAIIPDNDGTFNYLVGMLYTLKVSTDGKTWSKNNIAIDARKKAITGTDKVVIVT